VQPVKEAGVVADPLPHSDAKVAGSTAAARARDLGAALHGREQRFQKQVRTKMQDMLRWATGWVERGALASGMLQRCCQRGSCGTGQCCWLPSTLQVALGRHPWSMPLTSAIPCTH
jgi:hypothetical protein